MLSFYPSIYLWIVFETLVLVYLSHLFRLLVFMGYFVLLVIIIPSINFLVQVIVYPMEPIRRFQFFC